MISISLSFSLAYHIQELILQELYYLIIHYYEKNLTVILRLCFFPPAKFM